MKRPVVHRQMFVMMILAAVSISCEANIAPLAAPGPTAATTVLIELADSVFVPDYSEFEQSVYDFSESVGSFERNRSDANLQSLRDRWRAMRTSWEQCYACNIGQLATGAVVGAIDPWPVAYDRIDTLLEGQAPIDYITLESWEADVKGFHAIEYVIFGRNGAKAVTSFSVRELEYLSALTMHILSAATLASDSWQSNNYGNYYESFTTAGTGSTQYSTQRAALLEVVMGISSACDDVASENLLLAYNHADSSYDPSPFSDNAITEYADRVRSAKNIYLGGKSASGYGISALVRENDPALDSQIISAFDGSIGTVLQIPRPYSHAIASRATEMQVAAQSIAALVDLLDQKLLPIIQHVNS